MRAIDLFDSAYELGRLKAGCVVARAAGKPETLVNTIIVAAAGQCAAPIQALSTRRRCSKFMATFYQLGLEERSRRLAAQRCKDDLRASSIRNENQKRFELSERTASAHVLWPRTYDEEENEQDAPSLPYLQQRGGNKMGTSLTGVLSPGLRVLSLKDRRY